MSMARQYNSPKTSGQSQSIRTWISSLSPSTNQCKWDTGLLSVEQHQKSLLYMYKTRPGQMGTSNLSIFMGAMDVNGCRGQAWVAQVTSKLVSSVDGGVSPPILLVLNLTQLKSHGIRL